MNAVLEELGCARRALEGLLTILETEDPGEGRLRGAAERCAHSFERVTSELDRMGELEEDQRREVARELGELARLNALAASCASRKRDEVRGLLRRARGERKSLTFYKPGGTTGVSCDISG